jgi:hypothetical protein
MDKKRKEGYVTGIGCLVIFAFFILIAISTGWNTSGQIFWVFAILFGGLGLGSLWKPDSVGAVASEFVKNLSKGSEEGSSDSHDKQIQKKSSGSVQVMAHDQSNVHISVHSGKKKNAQNLPEESENLQDKEKETLRKEKIVVRPSGSYSYEFEDLVKDDHLKGEIVSTERISIYFVDSINFDKWDRGVGFEFEDCNEDILEAEIDYSVPKKGTWYILISNDGKKSAIVKVQLY